MLVNFRFKNCRSFYDEAVLSMEATTDTELREINTFYINEKIMPKGENELLKSAVIFGGNASGKTNVLKALSYMRNVILTSASQWPIVQGNEYFTFYENASDEESLYEVELIQDKVFYRYGFTILHGAITSEWLDKREERIANVFKRTGNSITIVGSDKAAAKVINLTPNTLFLSMGANYNLLIRNMLLSVMQWFQNLLIVFENNANSLEIYNLEHGKYKRQALEILALADIGIKDLEVTKDRVVNMADLNSVLRFNTQLQTQPLTGQLKQEDSNIYNIDVQTSFDVYNAAGQAKRKKKVLLFKNIGFNSEGTERLLCYLGWLLAALDQGRVLVIDEMDSKLHFLVADYLIKLFNSIDKNPKNAQLICTAHNVMLMDEDLRRDQIYFTSKDKFGASTLISLADFKNVRKTELFSKRYLAGFYAALPDMTKGL